jgi:AmiR/NasT family two-component response regulator
MSQAPTPTPLRVVVVEDDEAIRLGLVRALEQIGHQVVGQAASGPEMVELCAATELDVILFDVHLPGMSGLDAWKRIAEQKEAAGVCITADRDAELFRRAGQDRVLGFLIKPFDDSQLGPTLEVAYARFAEICALSADNARLQKTLEARKLIERAKGVLMKRHRWGEAEAFRRLQRAAMNQRTTMAELARQVIDGIAVEL